MEGDGADSPTPRITGDEMKADEERKGPTTGSTPTERRGYTRRSAAEKRGAWSDGTAASGPLARQFGEDRRVGEAPRRPRPWMANYRM